MQEYSTAQHGAELEQIFTTPELFRRMDAADYVSAEISIFVTPAQSRRMEALEEGLAVERDPARWIYYR